MPTILRRLRGLLGVGVSTGLVWAIIGAAIVAVGSVVDPASVDPGEGPLWAAWTLGRAGFLAGMIAAAVLSVAERQRGLAGLSLPRAALWGAVGGAALPWIMAPMAMLPLLALLGAGTTTAIVGLGRRAERLAAGREQPALRVRQDGEAPSSRSG